MDLADFRRVVAGTPIKLYPSIDGELVNIPAAQGVEQTVQIRLNNALLERPTVDDGWLVLPVAGLLLATGANLVGISAQGRAPDAPQLVVEKLEIAVVCEAAD